MLLVQHRRHSSLLIIKKTADFELKIFRNCICFPFLSVIIFCCWCHNCAETWIITLQSLHYFGLGGLWSSLRLTAAAVYTPFSLVLMNARSDKYIMVSMSDHNYVVSKLSSSEEDIKAAHWLSKAEKKEQTGVVVILRSERGCVRSIRSDSDSSKQLS